MRKPNISTCSCLRNNVYLLKIRWITWAYLTIDGWPTSTSANKQLNDAADTNYSKWRATYGTNANRRLLNNLVKVRLCPCKTNTSISKLVNAFAAFDYSGKFSVITWTEKRMFRLQWSNKNTTSLISVSVLFTIKPTGSTVYKLFVWADTCFVMLPAEVLQTLTKTTYTSRTDRRRSTWNERLKANESINVTKHWSMRHICDGTC
jgi:hypothetical protein